MYAIENGCPVYGIDGEIYSISKHTECYNYLKDCGLL
jgi:hypothetical protein